MTGICGHVLDISVYLDMTTFSGLTVCLYVYRHTVVQ